MTQSPKSKLEESKQKIKEGRCSVLLSVSAPVGRLLLSCKTLKESLDAESFQGRLANHFINVNHDHCCDLQCLEELKKLSGAEKFRLFRENYLLQVRSDT
jgi:hypothetical protein